MKNEGNYVLEWIAYHLAIGFDRIAIYDNQSTDSTGLLCQCLAKAGVIDYVRWPDPAPDAVAGPQIYAYEHAVATMQADWLCFLDADEFLVLETAGTVGELIAAAGQAGMPIVLNWRIFGSGGAVEASAGLVTDRFVRCGSADHVVNHAIKTFGPVSVLWGGAGVHIHGWVLTPGQHCVDAAGQPVDVDRCTFVRPPRWTGAWINHYIVKSRDEFELKRLRGRATFAAGSTEKFNRSYEEYFLQYDCNEYENRTIQRFRPALIAKLDLLKSIIKKHELVRPEGRASLIPGQRSTRWVPS